MDLLGPKPELVERPEADPSITSQLRFVYAHNRFDRASHMRAYMDAIQKAPDVSEGTKRKWKKALNLG